jgi:hypothetical protein
MAQSAFKDSFADAYLGIFDDNIFTKHLLP